TTRLFPYTTLFRSQRQRSVARPRQEGGNHDVVQRQGESQEPSSHQGGEYKRQRNDEEHFKRRCTEVQGGLFQRSVQLAYARLDDDRHISHAQRYVAYPYREDAVAGRPSKQLADLDKHQQ